MQSFEQVGSGTATCLTPKCMLLTSAIYPAPVGMFIWVCSGMIKNCNQSMYPRIGDWLKSYSTSIYPIHGQKSHTPTELE